MRSVPDRNDPVFQRSETELRIIAEWYSSHFAKDLRPIKFLLVGGWAVWCYNPYYPSVDIDIVVTNKARSSLFHHLRRSRAFDFTMSAERNRMVFMIPYEGKEIIIDYDKPDSPGDIEGHAGSLPWAHALENFKVFDVGKGYLPVPERGILLLHKLKAIVERSWKLEHEGADRLWLTGKIAKDRADVLAMLDPAKGGRDIDISLLGGLIKALPCLLDALKGIPDHRESHERYGCAHGEAEDWTARLVSLISPD